MAESGKKSETKMASKKKTPKKKVEAAPPTPPPAVAPVKPPPPPPLPAKAAVVEKPEPPPSLIYFSQYVSLRGGNWSISDKAARMQYLKERGYRPKSKETIETWAELLKNF